MLLALAKTIHLYRIVSVSSFLEMPVLRAKPMPTPKIGINSVSVKLFSLVVIRGQGLFGRDGRRATAKQKGVGRFVGVIRENRLKRRFNSCQQRVLSKSDKMSPKDTLSYPFETGGREAGTDAYRTASEVGKSNTSSGFARRLSGAVYTLGQRLS